MKKETATNWGMDILEESSQNNSNWLNQTLQTFSGFYRQQFNQVFDFMSEYWDNQQKVMKSFWEPESRGLAMVQKNSAIWYKNLEFLNALNKGILNRMSVTSRKNGELSYLSDDFFDTLFHVYNNQYKQMLQALEGINDFYNGYFKSYQFGSSDWYKNYHKGMESGLNMYQSALKNMLMSYHAMPIIPEDRENKFMEQWSKQLDLIGKGSQKFWNDLYRLMSVDMPETVKSGAKEEQKSSSVSKKQMV